MQITSDLETVGSVGNDCNTGLIWLLWICHNKSTEWTETMHFSELLFYNACISIYNVLQTKTTTAVSERGLCIAEQSHDEQLLLQAGEDI